MLAAAEMAHCRDFIEALPDGFATMVGDRGVKLSGGQRQRLAIARALLKDAPILLLDEATSALDSESERAIQDALDRLMQGRTVIAIAHRLSTLKRFDRIIVMDHGRIIDDGPPDVLAARPGPYRDLLRKQQLLGTDPGSGLSVASGRRLQQGGADHGRRTNGRRPGGRRARCAEADTAASGSAGAARSPTTSRPRRSPNGPSGRSRCSPSICRAATTTSSIVASPTARCGRHCTTRSATRVSIGRSSPAIAG